MRKAAIVVMIMLLMLPAIPLPGVFEIQTGIEDVSEYIIASEPYPPPEGIVSWWTGDGNTYDYIDNNHGTMEGDTSFAPGIVGDAFSFDGYDDEVWMESEGISHLQEMSIECWVMHDTPLQDEIDRYVSIGNEKAVIRHDSYNLHFYMTFIGEQLFYDTLDLVVPYDPEYYPFDPEEAIIDPNQFSFVLIEGLQEDTAVNILAEFTNGDSDFMVWPGDWPLSMCSFGNNIAGWDLSTGEIPEEGNVWVPSGCNSLRIGCFNYDRQEEGTWTISINEILMKHIWVPIDWEPNVFHHVACTYDGSTMRLYMDGGLVGDLFVGLPSASSDGVWINSGGECLDGLIDEVSIYNRALSDEEILEIYNAAGAGKEKPEDDYYQYSRFYPETEYLASVGGYVEDYGDPDEWGDELQYLYCVGDTTGYKISVELTDYEDEHPGQDTLSPGWIEPHQHPNNPDAPGPVEPRHFAIVSQVLLSYDGFDYTVGAGYHSGEFHVDERGIFLGAWPYGIFRWDHDWNDLDSDGIMDYAADQIAYAPDVPPDSNNIGRTETLAYNPDDNIWYAGARCFGWEYRDIYQIVDNDGDGDFLDEEWEIAFSYPALNPENPNEHHDGLEYAGGYLWISDMYSDRIAQW
jgi:hypothetical protein